MRASLKLLSSLCLPIGLLHAQAPERQFDFWVGDWRVENRNLTKQGWQASGTSHARIRKVCDGHAILEEWDGQSGWHARTFGISLRAWDPKKRRWIIALAWPNGGKTKWGQMEGVFRHGRGEFFPKPAWEALEASRKAASASAVGSGTAPAGPPRIPVRPRAQRFTFSDALANSCRWDMAQPVAETAWRTTWIMEFSRRAAPKDRVELAPPPAKSSCEIPADFDAWIGAWKGKGHAVVGGKKVAVRAEFRASAANRGCARLCWLDVKGEGVAFRRFAAWIWDHGARRWVARSIDTREPGMTELRGRFSEGGGRFGRRDRTRLLSIDKVRDGGFDLKHEASRDRGKTWKPELSLRFAR